MRAATSDQVEALESLDRVTRLYAEVERNGTWYDLTALAGENWLTAIDYTEDENQIVPSATLELHRETHEASLAPLVQDPPLLVGGARIRVGAEVMVPGGPSTGRKNLLEGRLNGSSWGGSASVITVEIRDVIMSRLHDRSTTEDFELPSGALEDLVQDTLDEWTPGIELVVVGDPEFAFPEPSVIRPQTVEAAIRSLVDQSGWEIRRFEIAGEFRLVLFEPIDPSEEAPEAVTTYTPRDYFDIPSMGLNSIGFRDQVIITYMEGDTRVTVTVETPTPRFGDDYRSWPLDETGNPLVTSLATAQAFGRKGLLASARTPVTKEVELPFDWRPELADWSAFAPNGIHYSQTFEGAVTSIRHRVEAGISDDGGGTTTLGIRGAFAGRVQRWVERVRRTRLRREIEDTVGPPPPPAVPGAGTLAWFLTTLEGEEGFSEESVPHGSLGRYVSRTLAGPNLFRSVTAAEADDGITLYRSTALVNQTEEFWYEGLRAYIGQQLPGGVTLEIAVDPDSPVPLGQEDPQGGESSDEESPPVPISGSLSWGAPESVEDGQVIGTVPPMHAVIVHRRLVVPSSTSHLISEAAVCIDVCYPSDSES
jgi:hypothetical protein